MSERTSYAPGTPAGSNCGTPDMDASIEFYGGLFGWEVPEQPRTRPRPAATARRNKGGKPTSPG